MNGKTVAHYRITEKLGQGGMGEVYRATETKLNRDVALKLLPESIAQDGQRIVRFQREAQVLAALNHPNIAQIYGLETDSEPGTAEQSCLVMELVEGEDLSERIDRGPIPVEEALEIALQIAPLAHRNPREYRPRSRSNADEPIILTQRSACLPWME